MDIHRRDPARLWTRARRADYPRAFGQAFSAALALAGVDVRQVQVKTMRQRVDESCRAPLGGCPFRRGCGLSAVAASQRARVLRGVTGQGHNDLPMSRTRERLGPRPATLAEAMTCWSWSAPAAGRSAPSPDRSPPTPTRRPDVGRWPAAGAVERCHGTFRGSSFYSLRTVFLGGGQAVLTWAPLSLIGPASRRCVAAGSPGPYR